MLPAGVALGIGLGGFVDGIVFHQLLQLHNMLSAVYPPDTVVNLELNMIWDGLFHSFTWCMTVLGAALIGWGAFNLVEGVVDHFVLQIHHVVERAGLSVWDWVFVGSGVALIAAGAGLIRSEPEPYTGQHTPPARAAPD